MSFQGKTQLKALSPTYVVHGARYAHLMPPVLLLHGTRDTCAPLHNATQFAKALLGAGIQVVCFTFGTVDVHACCLIFAVGPAGSSCTCHFLASVLVVAYAECTAMLLYFIPERKCTCRLLDDCLLHIVQTGWCLATHIQSASSLSLLSASADPLLVVLANTLMYIWCARYHSLVKLLNTRA